MRQSELRDPEFLTKAKYAPWVDAVMRFTGPIARQNQHLFSGDWMAYTNEDIREVLLEPMEPPEPDFQRRSWPAARQPATPQRPRCSRR